MAGEVAEAFGYATKLPGRICQRPADCGQKERAENGMIVPVKWCRLVSLGIKHDVLYVLAVSRNFAIDKT